jgi:hypothetical protein
LREDIGVVVHVARRYGRIGNCRCSHACVLPEISSTDQGEAIGARLALCTA